MALSRKRQASQGKRINRQRTTQRRRESQTIISEAVAKAEKNQETPIILYEPETNRPIMAISAISTKETYKQSGFKCNAFADLKI